MGNLSFVLLGPTAVIGDEGEIALHGRVRRRLLVRLLVDANHAVAVDRLAEDLWDGRPPASATSTLKSHISLLRRSLGSDRIHHRDGAYLITVHSGSSTHRSSKQRHLKGDLFSSATRRLPLRCSEWPWHDGAERHSRTPPICRGAAPKQFVWRSCASAALEGWLSARLVLGRYHEVIADAEAAVSEHPLREGLWAKLMVALYACGRQAEALRAVPAPS